MATIIFYEKPGCVGNARQRARLRRAGHQLIVRNLLTEPWTAESLRPFFGNRSVADWFNRQAPQIKSGAIAPELLDADTALQLMLDNPLLIRRPLLQVGERRELGFEPELIDDWIGLDAEADDSAVAYERCSREAANEQ